MAATLVPKNPRWVGGPILQEAPVKVLAADSQTWKAGQWGYFASGEATFCDDDATVIQFVFLEDQTTSTSTTSVRIAYIKPGMLFEMFELNGTIGNANRGESYALDLTSNILTVDVDDTGHDAVQVIKLGVEYDPERNKSDDIKARMIVMPLTACIEG